MPTEPYTYRLIRPDNTVAYTRDIDPEHAVHHDARESGPLGEYIVIPHDMVPCARVHRYVVRSAGITVDPA